MPTTTDDCLLFSDCHGAFYTLIRLLNKAPKGLRVISLGDEIDRGPHSRKVVEFVMSNGIPSVASNHVDLCLAYSAHTKRGYKAKCTSYYERDIWLYNGGDWALGNWPHFDSKGHRCGERIPDEVLDWMAALPPYLYPSECLDENGRKLLASHTGYGLNADSDHWISALWGRHMGGGAGGDGPFKLDPETWKEADDGYHRVFGHTRVKEAVVTDQWSCIDTGAAYGEPFGVLSALLWPSKMILTQPYDETPCEPTFAVVNGIIS